MLHLHDTTKPFTPIHWTDTSLQFLIRLYPNGKFSTYIKDIELGDKIRVRGPYGNFKYKFNRFVNSRNAKSVAFITCIFTVLF